MLPFTITGDGIDPRPRFWLSRVVHFITGEDACSEIPVRYIGLTLATYLDITT